MSLLPKPEVIITHESDLDGLVSGLLLQRLARRLFDLHVPVEAHHYHTWRQREPKENAVWVSDLSFEPRFDKPNWVFIDHHATEVPPRQAKLIHDLNKSAGLLCYELSRDLGIGSPELDRLVHLNNVADLFLQSEPDFLLANDYANLVKVYGFWHLHELIDGRLEKILDHPLLEVMTVRRRVEDPLGLEWSRRHVTPLTATIGHVEIILGNSNLIVHRMLEEQLTPYPVLVTLYKRPNGVMIASVRSRNGQALRVAEQLRGGGHANAAGATLPRSVRNTGDAVQYLRQILNPPVPKPELRPGVEHLFTAIEAPSQRAG